MGRCESLRPGVSCCGANASRDCLPRPQPVMGSRNARHLGWTRRHGMGSTAICSNNFARVRLELARERGVPPYVIFGDAALRDMARRRPSTLDRFLAVNGVGEKKYRGLWGPLHSGDQRLVQSAWTFAGRMVWSCRTSERPKDRCDVAGRTEAILGQRAGRVSVVCGREVD